MGRRQKLSVWGVFTLVFMLELAVGYYLTDVYGFMSGDAMSRVANAFYTLYSRFPGLANIGFVWNPLPSLLELPLLVLYPVYPEIASSGLAAVFMTSLFAALTAGMLVRAGIRFGMKPWLSITFALLYALNPYIFYYGANGLTESIFITFITMAVVQLLLWIQKDDMFPISIIAFMLAFGFWTRYEAVPLGIAFAGAVMLVNLRMRNSALSLSERLYKTEGSLIVLLTPAVFSGLLWIFFNYTIMGDALYFLHSSYSNLGQAELIKNNEVFAALTNHPVRTLAFVARKMSYFCMPVALIAMIRLCERRLFQTDFVILLLLAFAIPAMQFVLLLKGASAAWIRYYMYPLPIAIAWLPYEWSMMKYRKTWSALAVVALLASSVVLTMAMNNPKVASDEYEAFHRNKLYREQEAKREVAAYLRERLPNARILTDSFSSFGVIMSSRMPKQFIMTSDRDFESSLAEPRTHNVDYILLPNPVAVLALDQVNRSYPELYANGADWVSLEREFGEYWKLYKVKADPKVS
ncbi:hypothetical protein [Paenibacillus sp. MBLB4367]|uniref:hypothetical protein n=1 Tax=Paenibacillus sp. MBLB4367 TaxID=3384767 RepID=UPI0039083BB0